METTKTTKTMEANQKYGFYITDPDTWVHRGDFDFEYQDGNSNTIVKAYKTLGDAMLHIEGVMKFETIPNDYPSGYYKIIQIDKNGKETIVFKINVKKVKELMNLGIL
jgi:hypothetical protein